MWSKCTHTHLHLHSTCLHQRYLANISDASMRKLTQSGRALGDARWDHGDLTSNSGAFKQTNCWYDDVWCEYSGNILSEMALSLNGDSTSNSGINHPWSWWEYFMGYNGCQRSPESEHPNSSHVCPPVIKYSVLENPSFSSMIFPTAVETSMDFRLVISQPTEGYPNV